MTFATYNSSADFPTKAEAFAHLERFEYSRLPVANRWSNRSTGDHGEARIGFAHIEAIDTNGTVTGYRVHEVDMPLDRKRAA